MISTMSLAVKFFLARADIAVAAINPASRAFGAAVLSLLWESVTAMGG